MDASFFLGTFVFVFGLIIGSFLNCVIYRLEQKESLTGRSYCPRCKHVLSWLELFPVFSFLYLKGKCGHCDKKISIQYPLVEISTAVMFLLIFSRQGGIFLFYIASSLIVIFVYDLKHYLIPDKILFPAIIITFAYRLFENLINSNFSLLNYFYAAIIGSGFFLFIFLISKGRWMGFGDVKLAILMGFLTGLPNILVALFLAFFFGAIIGVILMAFKKKGLKSEIPFGPFLILGTFFALLWGSKIVQWYLSLYA